MRALYTMVLLAWSMHTSWAHIGSPNIVYEGDAGPYRILATIQPPDVVPGIASILIELNEAEHGSVDKVIVQPVYFQYGSAGAPEGDNAVPVPGSDDLYAAELWLMTFGSSSVKITIEGSRGKGSTIVPVPAVATATRDMDPITGSALMVMGVFLLLALVSIIGGTIREATLPLGIKADASRKKKAMMVMAGTFIFFVSGLVMAHQWWLHVEQDYRKNMFRSLTMSTHLSQQDANTLLNIAVHNDVWLDRKISDLVPDHDKLMHMFLIEPVSQTFSHLHPDRIDTNKFQTSLPDLAKGSYLVFAEVVHENGMAETLTDTLLITEPVRGALPSSDDFSGHVPLVSADMTIIDGLHAQMLNYHELQSGKPIRLTFAIKDAQGNAAQLQPYLGMAGHAVVMHEDASVFIHLHPMGTISMASQYSLAKKVSGDLTLCGPVSDSLAIYLETADIVDERPLSVMRSGEAALNGEKVVFPYLFPKPGYYYIWLQVKHNGMLKTAGFKVKVT